MLSLQLKLPAKEGQGCDGDQHLLVLQAHAGRAARPIAAGPARVMQAQMNGEMFDRATPSTLLGLGPVESTSLMAQGFSVGAPPRRLLQLEHTARAMELDRGPDQPVAQPRAQPAGDTPGSRAEVLLRGRSAGLLLQSR